MSQEKATIIWSYFSPYVRKVLACLEIKQVPYEIDPIVPYFGNEEFNSLSPLPRIPVLMDSKVTLCNSTAICEYINEAYPGSSLLPGKPELRARIGTSRIGRVAGVRRPDHGNPHTRKAPGPACCRRAAHCLHHGRQ